MTFENDKADSRFTVLEKNGDWKSLCTLEFLANKKIEPWIDIAKSTLIQQLVVYSFLLEHKNMAHGDICHLSAFYWICIE